MLYRRWNNTIGVSHTGFSFPWTWQRLEFAPCRRNNGKNFPAKTNCGHPQFARCCQSGSDAAARWQPELCVISKLCSHFLLLEFTRAVAKDFSQTVEVNPCASDAPLSNVCQNQFPSKVRGESYPTISWRWVKCILENSCEQQRFFFVVFFHRTGHSTSSARLGQSSLALTSKPYNFMCLILWSLWHSYGHFGLVLLNGLFKVSPLGRKLAPVSDLHQWLTKDGMSPLDRLIFVGPPQFMAAI